VVDLTNVAVSLRRDEALFLNMVDDSAWFQEDIGGRARWGGSVMGQIEGSSRRSVMATLILQTTFQLQCSVSQGLDQRRRPTELYFWESTIRGLRIVPDRNRLILSAVAGAI